MKMKLKLMCVLGAVLGAVACGGAGAPEDTSKTERSGEALCTGDGTGACQSPSEPRDPLLGNWCFTYGGNGTPQYPWKVARMSITLDGKGTLLTDMTPSGYCYNFGWDFGTDITWTHLAATFYERPSNTAVNGRDYSVTTHSAYPAPSCPHYDSGIGGGRWSTNDAGAGHTGTQMIGPNGWVWLRDDINGNGCHAGV